MLANLSHMYVITQLLDDNIHIQLNLILLCSHLSTLDISFLLGTTKFECHVNKSTPLAITLLP
jgi:hypothetical protein